MRQSWREPRVGVGAVVALALAVWMAPGALGAQQKPNAEVQKVLDAMVVAWNRDDLEGHVGAYAPDATYTTSDGVLHGREGVRGALQGFVRPEGLVGELRFEDEEARMLGSDHALVTGRYVLAMPGRDESAGRFTLVFERRAGVWMVIHDHSS